MKQQFRGMDAFSAERVHSDADTFGETPILTIVNLLETLKSHLPKIPEPFVDLGCGRGLSCLTAASCGFSALGFERELRWVEAATRVSSALGLSADFSAGDFLEQPWPEKGTFFIVATAFEDDLRQAIASRLQSLSPGSVIVTVDWSLEAPHLEALWQAKLPVDWGTAQFEISLVGAAPASSESS